MLAPWRKPGVVVWKEKSSPVGAAEILISNYIRFSVAPTGLGPSDHPLPTARAVGYNLPPFRGFFQQPVQPCRRGAG